MPENRRLYLDLLKRALINEIGAENELRLNYLWRCAEKGEAVDRALLFDIGRRLPKRRAAFLEARRNGQMLPDGEPDRWGFSDSMVGLRRLDQLQAAIETVVEEGVPGDILEAGVWRGGAAIFARGVLASLGVTDRTVWLADSFQGLPAPIHALDSDFSKQDSLAVSLDQVQDAFRRYGLLDEKVAFLPGWFEDTLPQAPVDQLAILRADGDLFSSTLEILTNLYPKLAPGGFVIIDDYGALQDCRAAVHAYRARHALSEPIEPIDGMGVFWRKATRSAA